MDGSKHAGVSLVDVVHDLIESIADGELRGEFRDREAVAFEARAEERETRGFISMMTMRPFLGLSPHWTLEPPVSTPIARMTASEASRIFWYSRSVSVWAGLPCAVAGMHTHRDRCFQWNR